MRNLTPLFALALFAGACVVNDLDRDGVPSNMDCNDGDPSVYPGATEICDGIDNDCNQVVDDDYALGGQIYFLDRDGDGAGVWELAQVRCVAPVGYVDNADDCMDDDPQVYPGATEFCDKVDQDCNGIIDDDPADGLPYYPDLDEDGFGSIEAVQLSCELVSGLITVGGDCDDYNALINPLATETCNLIDDDCNGIIDDASSEDATVWYADNDLDGYGNGEVTTTGCSQPEYFVGAEAVGDCDDSDPDINPGASEICNDGIDNNCNDSADACSYTEWGYGKGDMTEITGTGSSAYFGRDLAFVGDVNGDGFDDALVGGYRASGGACSGGYCGGAMLFFGGEDVTRANLSIADSVYLSGTSRYEYAGISVAGLGDLNGDGYDDMGVGAYGNGYNGSYSGSVYIVYGGNNLPEPGDVLSLNSAAQVFGEYSYDYFGYSVAGGDFNGDGYSDAFMGTPYGETDTGYPGKMHLYYGGPEKLSFEPSTDSPAFYGGQNSEYLGASSGHGLASGDFNADGLDDFIIGSHYYDHAGNSSSGRVYVGYGVTDTVAGLIALEDYATIYNGASRYGYLGSSVSGVGDVNGDGYEDMSMCGYGESDYRGMCYVRLGGTETAPVSWTMDEEGSSDFSVVGPESYYYMGYYGVGGADYDADGLSDLTIGAYQYRPDSSTYGTGGFGIIPGAEEHLESYKAGIDFPISHPKVRYQYAGSISSESGDLNGDGFPDALIGAYGAASYSGQAHVFFGGGM